MELKKLIISDEIVFNAKPDAVPYNYRISYKVAQLCLILKFCCSREASSLIKIQMVSMSLVSSDYLIKLLEFIENPLNRFTVIRFDPAVNRALKYSIAEGLIEQQKNGLFKLSSKGKFFVDMILKQDELMQAEIEILKRISTRLTEKNIKSLTTLWRYNDVEN